MVPGEFIFQQTSRAYIPQQQLSDLNSIALPLLLMYP